MFIELVHTFKRFAGFAIGLECRLRKHLKGFFQTFGFVDCFVKEHQEFQILKRISGLNFNGTNTSALLLQQFC